jgi:hypothetical protein
MFWALGPISYSLIGALVAAAAVVAQVLSTGICSASLPFVSSVAGGMFPDEQGHGLVRYVAAKY